MNRKWWKLIYMLPITFCTLYAGGYVAQFIRNYQTWESAGNFAGNGTAPQIPSPNPLACLDALTAFPYNLYGIFLCLAAFGLLTFLLMRMGFDRNGEITDRDRNLNYSTKGTYGTSGFMTLEEMHQVLELTNDVKKHKGTILGKLNGKAVCLPKDTRMNRNIAVYGASGSMKSRAFARNMIFQCVARGESLIITDPKSELYESTATYLENAGYIVKSFNLVNPENSDSWNCLGEISGQETMAQVFADVIIQNTGSAKGDHFWDNAEMNLLKALILYVDQGFPPEAKNIGQVYAALLIPQHNTARLIVPKKRIAADFGNAFRGNSPLRAPPFPRPAFSAAGGKRRNYSQTDKQGYNPIRHFFYAGFQNIFPPVSGIQFPHIQKL